MTLEKLKSWWEERRREENYEVRQIIKEILKVEDIYSEIEDEEE